jgi:uncharacterized protein YbbC (DUF1343 family)
MSPTDLPGVEFEPAAFIPDASAFKRQECHGIRIVLKDCDSFESGALGVESLCPLQRYYPAVFQLDPALDRVGSRTVLRALADGIAPESIVASWPPQLDKF